jgi:sugar/nucleoside kinase (ribokinase family)
MGILNLGARPARFRGLVGTGGIGHGSFFRVDGNETLGREESRSGRLLECRDYCKLHIICHYVKALMGDGFAVYPVGRTGDDEAGRRLLAEMKAAGLDMRFVRAVPGRPTLYSFCVLYPDGSGGNLTTRDSACSSVGREAIIEAEPTMADLGAHGIAVAAPEVPLATRAALLELATRHGLFRAASFTRAEMAEVDESGMLAAVDLLAVNLEEAAAALGATAPGRAGPGAAATTVRQVAEGIARRYPRLLLSVTDGARGSWAWDGSSLCHEPARAVTVAGTSGAGDAHFAGMLAGLAAGLPFGAASRLAALVAAASVASADTINFGITRETIRSLCGDGKDAPTGLLPLLDN